MPKDYLKTTFKAIRNFKHGLQLKPLEYDENQTKKRIELIIVNQCSLLINHEYRLTSYFYYLRNLIKESNSYCKRIEIEWFDSYVEIK